MGVELLLDKLQGVKAAGQGRWKALCPAHEERTASLSIMELDDGRVLLHCFGCGAGAVDIIRAAGLEPKDVFPPLDESGEAYQPMNTDYMKAEAIDDLRGEAILLQAAHYWISAGRAMTENYQARLESSEGRITAACKVLGINIDTREVGKMLNKWLAESAEAGLEWRDSANQSEVAPPLSTTR